jgi:hypothetical protein
MSQEGQMKDLECWNTFSSGWIPEVKEKETTNP